MSFSKWNFAMLVLLAFIPVVVSLVEETQPMTNAEVLQLIKKINSTDAESSIEVRSYGFNFVNHNHAHFHTIFVEAVKTGMTPELMARFEALELLIKATPQATINITLQYFADLTGMPVEKVNKTTLEFITLVTETTQFVNKYLKPLSAKVKAGLYMMGAGDHTYPWVFVIVPFSATLIHWTLDMHRLRSTTLFTSLGPLAWIHVKSAAVIFVMTWFSPIGDNSEDGITQASGVYGLACISTALFWAYAHGALFEKAAEVTKQQKLDAVDAAKMAKIDAEIENRTTLTTDLQSSLAKTRLTVEKLAKGGGSVYPGFQAAPRCL